MEDTQGFYPRYELKSWAIVTLFLLCILLVAAGTGGCRTSKLSSDKQTSAPTAYPITHDQRTLRAEPYEQTAGHGRAQH